MAEEPRLLEVIPAGPLPWQAETLLVLVPGGQGALRWVRASLPEANPGDIYLLLRNLPLVQWHWYPCPTCEQLLAVGNGRAQADPEALARLRAASAEPHRVIAERDLAAIAPLLDLLEPGIYGIACIPHAPTDGSGRFFWDSPGTGWRQVPAARELIPTPRGDYVATGPAFLFPSQPATALDCARVEHYRRLAAAGGSEPGGLALHLQGAVSALLDGHHRATAACLAEQQLPCLTVMQVWSSFGRGKEPTMLLPGRPPLPAGHLPESVRQHLRQTMPCIPPEEAEQFHRTFPVLPPPAFPPDLKAAAERYATMDGVAAMIAVGGEITAEQVEQALAAADVERLGLLFGALEALDPARARPLAGRIAMDQRCSPLWRRVYRYLAARPAPETDELFIRFWVEDDGTRQEIKQIVDQYFRERD